MTDFKFSIIGKDEHSPARVGVINTSHGEIMTPSFVPVGTQATVKSISNEDLLEIGTQVFFVNTYHMYLRPGVEIIKKFDGLHGFINWKRPLMTDSGGFQVFSLGQGKKRLSCSSEAEQSLVKIDNEGVTFRSHFDGSKHYFTPEKSLEIQGVLGADITLVLDECPACGVDRDYANLSVQRTHRWAERSLKARNKLRKSQALYGIIQGSIFEDLRVESAKFISSLPFEGIAIGGVAVGESKEEMRQVLDFVLPHLPEHKPRHLLGVGEIGDIFTLVEHGIDTFDCVMPTRLGRMGWVLVKPKLEDRRWKLDITKAEYAVDSSPLTVDCNCFVCKNYSRAYINHLFRTRELLGYRLATYHNLFFLERLMGGIRKSLKEGSFIDLKKEWL